MLLDVTLRIPLRWQRMRREMRRSLALDTLVPILM